MEINCGLGVFGCGAFVFIVRAVDAGMRTPPLEGFFSCPSSMYFPPMKTAARTVFPGFRWVFARRQSVWKSGTFSACHW